MIPSTCLHPKFLRCRDGKMRSVPCGKCAACLVNKGLRKSNRIKDYIVGYQYQFFITLTFDDKYLPLARFSFEDYSLYHDLDCDYNGVVYSHNLSECNEEEIQLLQETIDKYGGVPVLSHRVLINFKKRLRYHLEKLNYGKDIFLYGCGEYGPTSYRPHYHLLFGGKSPISTSLFKECVSKAWSFCTKTKSGDFYSSFGFTKVDRSFGKASIDYIAKYINCTTHLPSYLADARWRPFSSGSTRCSQFLYRLSQGSLREVFNKPTYDIDVLRNGKYVNESVPDSYKCRYFPLISKFNYFNDYELYRLYSLYQRYPDGKSAYEQFQNDWFKCDWNIINTYNMIFDGRQEVYNPLSVLQMSVHRCCFVNCDNEEIFDEFIRKRNFMRLWYVSRRVCFNAKELDVSVNEFVDKIIEYYKGLELYKLRKFYEYQNELMDDIVHPVSLDAIFTMYYNTDLENIDSDYYIKQFGWSGSSVNDIPQQQQYAELREGILLDTTKTKKRNDLFFSRGLAPRKFVPRISTNVSKFIKL